MRPAAFAGKRRMEAGSIPGTNHRFPLSRPS